MPFKGFNSIIFDFDSIIDIEASLIKYFTRRDMRDYIPMITFIDMNKALLLNDDNIKFERLYGKEDLFSSLLLNPDHKKVYRELIQKFFERDQKEILEGGFAFKTSMPILLTAYKKAGNGIIKTAVRCDNQDQADFIHRDIDSSINTIIATRDKVDMDKYGTLIVGYYGDALEYSIDDPKIIEVLSFRENFDKDNSTMLNPELIINLGDVNDIKIISAYREDEFIKG